MTAPSAASEPRAVIPSEARDLPLATFPPSAGCVLFTSRQLAGCRTQDAAHWLFLPPAYRFLPPAVCLLRRHPHPLPLLFNGIIGLRSMNRCDPIVIR